MSIPNFFTLLRIVLIPLFGWLWWTGQYVEALGLYILAGLTDMLDGFLARYLDQRTRLGALLDPAADKLMLLISFLVASAVGAVPWWLAALVIGRDIFFSAGAAALSWYWRRRRGTLLEWPPSRLGKYSTFLLLSTIALALLGRAARIPALYPWVGGLALLATGLTAISTLQYVGRTAAMLGRELLGGVGWRETPTPQAQSQRRTP
ncbi:MAG TPA: CDP-alcohol phosphatidyltransferase family protein [Polyangia bacterium]|jgi:cardiolipin synthase|nr:CDP-alcohol phosphatidyltransferase family protein [Polyangia bacterium]